MLKLCHDRMGAPRGSLHVCRACYDHALTLRPEEDIGRQGDVLHADATTTGKDFGTYDFYRARSAELTRLLGDTTSRIRDAERLAEERGAELRALRLALGLSTRNRHGEGSKSERAVRRRATKIFEAVFTDEGGDPDNALLGRC